MIVVFKFLVGHHCQFPEAPNRYPTNRCQTWGQDAIVVKAKDCREKAQKKKEVRNVEWMLM